MSNKFADEQPATSHSCNQCGGDGHIKVPTDDGRGIAKTVRCHSCNGSGEKRDQLRKVIPPSRPGPLR